ncbi:transposase [Longibacter salinarum]|uniref:Transposase n=1 Tax=Longibacter salinarum TaxID=1850348 RepID=A0A2A8CWQ8_9BACT|nr:transposase [Longibacter salinarum]PEN13051.1 transposase [Longibacter salinarum]
MPRPDFPQRKNSLRHPDIDYSSRGAYFVTVRTHRRRPLFGSIRDGVMDCSPTGDIVRDEWYRTETLRGNVVLDAFVVMPDHVHGILCLVPEGVTEVSPRGYRWRPLAPPDAGNAQSLRARRHDPERHGVAYRPPNSLSSIMVGFKGAVTRRIRAECDIQPDARIWQRTFYDRVLRNEREWRSARQYIRLNPQRWWEKHGR